MSFRLLVFLRHQTPPSLRKVKYLKKYRVDVLYNMCINLTKSDKSVNSRFDIR